MICSKTIETALQILKKKMKNAGPFPRGGKARTVDFELFLIMTLKTKATSTR